MDDLINMAASSHKKGGVDLSAFHATREGGLCYLNSYDYWKARFMVDTESSAFWKDFFQAEGSGLERVGFGGLSSV